MNPSFNMFDFVEFVRARWRIAALTVISAVLIAMGVSLALPNKYTATASILIEPPGGSDPRISTAVSPVYLESLKTYEQLASSDSLFAQACARFGLLAGSGAPAVETFKRRVLEVRKPKETKLLQIAVTLHDPKKAQAVVQYLAERTVELSASITQVGDAAEQQRARARVETARIEMDRTEQELSSVSESGQQRSLEAEIMALSRVQTQVASDIADANAQVAELSARDQAGRTSPDTSENRQRLEAEKARLTALTANRAAVTRDIAAKSAILAAIDAKRDNLQRRLWLLQNSYDSTSKRLAEVESAAGMRSEQLRIIDPGIVPQRPSSPNIPLNCAAAFALALVAATVYLAMQFGMEQQRARHARSTFRVAQRDSA
jgi:uncharacterized protein involved in exopolysaccharide biosynthesis